MDRNKILNCSFFWPIIIFSICVPSIRLFEEGDWLYYVIREPAMHKAWLEIIILAVFVFFVCLRVKKQRSCNCLLLIILIAVSYLYGMLFPVLLASMYFLLILSISDFVTGTSIVILIATVLSIIKLCNPYSLLISVILTAIVVNIFRFKKSSDTNGVSLFQIIIKKSGFKAINSDYSLQNRLISAVVFLVVLVQIARANNCIDFDSLWYGVRSGYVLAPNGDIFEDLGLVGMVYTYPKGFEILTLPLSGTPSYSVITAFNLSIFIYGLKKTWSIVNTIGERKGAATAVILTALVPGIVNMTLSAKPDIITWALQITMLDAFFKAVRSYSRTENSITVISAFILSLAMKPTSFVFSTALFGMMLLYTFIRYVRHKNAENYSFHLSKHYLRVLLPLSALTIVCYRTWKLTGMPVTSVFSGILGKLGFTLKYPFAASSIPQSYQEGSPIVIALKRMVKMLLMPDGKDMSHVLIAWGGSIFFILSLIIVSGNILKLKQYLKTRNQMPLKGVNHTNPVSMAMWIIFLPYVIICFITLSMLYQVDGNYYMTLYSIIILSALYVLKEYMTYQTDENAGAGAYDTLKRSSSEKKNLPIYIPIVAICVFQFLFITMTNWAGTTGFTEISLNQGYYDHRAYYELVLTKEDGRIYSLLAENPQAKVVAFGTHPECLQFPCIVESYNDITSPWGNVEIVNTADAFIKYLSFFSADYVYADAEHLKEDAWQWSKGLLDEMTSRGVLYDFIFEGENWIAKVKKGPATL